MIECLNWSAFIPRYDSAATLFYLDPPYWGCEGDYGRELFSRAQFQLMADVLAGIEGRFLLSLNDVPEVRATFAAFQMAEVTTSYSIASHTGAAGGRAELLISNFALPG